MNVLIADDDRIIREGIAEYVDWESLGLHLAACAENGREALRVLSEEDIDILITDIRMPYLSGFELVNAASQKGRFPATIIISGYDDYEYLQQAIKLHIILGYVFKPIQLEQLIQLLKDAVEFRKAWLSKSKAPELTDADQRRYTYKDVVINLQNLESIYYALVHDDLDLAKELFTQNWNNIVDEGCSLNFAKRFAWEITISLIQLLGKDSISVSDIIMGADPLSLIAALEDKQEVFALLMDFLENIYLYQNSKIVYARRALETRFGDSELTLQQLADELNVTANYLGVLYKKERGETFATDLANKRIGHAKKLLVTTNWRVYRISSACGFSDAKYFASAFRRETGLTPSEYRARFCDAGRGLPLD